MPYLDVKIIKIFANVPCLRLFAYLYYFQINKYEISFDDLSYSLLLQVGIHSLSANQPAFQEIVNFCGTKLYNNYSILFIGLFEVAIFTQRNTNGFLRFHWGQHCKTELFAQTIH